VVEMRLKGGATKGGDVTVTFVTFVSLISIVIDMLKNNFAIYLFNLVLELKLRM
jgi:hypothetical protein